MKPPKRFTPIAGENWEWQGNTLNGGKAQGRIFAGEFLPKKKKMRYSYKEEGNKGVTGRRFF